MAPLARDSVQRAAGTLASGSMLSCPVCTEPLVWLGQVVFCARGHSFDVAREGYVNLTTGPVQRRADTREMVQARRRFLDAGHYAPLAQAINDAVSSALQRPNIAGDAVSRAPHSRNLPGGAKLPAIIDAGCGEGSYLGALARHLVETGQTEVSYLGLDLSRDALRLAARRWSEVRFVVSDLMQRWPVAPASVDVLLDIFAPRNPDEFARVAKPGGHALVVVPTERHLAALRQRYGLLGIEPDKPAHLREQLASAFEPVREHSLTFPLHLKPDDVRDLIGMSPNAWHADRPRGLDQAGSGHGSGEVADTAEVLLITFRRQ